MNIKVPLKSLRLPCGIGSIPMEGEEQETVSPEVNDPVSFSVEGVVKSVSGEVADVEVRFINGERPGQNEANEPDKGKGEPTEEELGKMAEKADMEGEE